MIGFLEGLIIGFIVVGTSVQRTLNVHRGNVLYTAVISIINSVAYFISIRYVVTENYVDFLGTAVGAVIVCSYLAYKNNKRRKLKYDSRKI